MLLQQGMAGRTSNKDTQVLACSTPRATVDASGWENRVRGKERTRNPAEERESNRLAVNRKIRGRRRLVGLLVSTSSNQCVLGT
jgi:hypothetical protein